MNVEIGAEAALFPEKEYIKGIFVAVYEAHSWCPMAITNASLRRSRMLPYGAIRCCPKAFTDDALRFSQMLSYSAHRCFSTALTDAALRFALSLEDAALFT
jgi:hypothetical protein